MSKSDNLKCMKLGQFRNNFRFSKLLALLWDSKDVIIERVSDRSVVDMTDVLSRRNKKSGRMGKMRSLSAAWRKDTLERTWDKGYEIDRVWRENFVPGLSSIQIQEIDTAFRAIERQILVSHQWLWKSETGRTPSVSILQFRPFRLRALYINSRMDKGESLRLWYGATDGVAVRFIVNYRFKYILIFKKC